MAKQHRTGKLAVILHADIADSTLLVQQDEHLAHERIQDAFRRFSTAIEKYQGRVHELRGDALLAEFDRASDAVTAVLSFQADQAYHNARIKDDIRPSIRAGIAMGEVVIADRTLTGAGVVLAQRVEQLADPGGVCITAALHEALPKRMPFDLENIGEQELKGFDDPVHVYRVELSAGKAIPAPPESIQLETSSRNRGTMAAFAVIALFVAGGAAYWFNFTEAIEDPTSVGSPNNLTNTAQPESDLINDVKLEPASAKAPALLLPDKPSIAVLPFTNMSADPNQEYFVDGMTEDLITDLAKIDNLFVVARNTVFTYKGKPVVVPDVARELGIKYVLEGSVRRVGDIVRINTQLIDGASGIHIWAERYDGALDDIFALQDEITGEIISHLSITLSPDAQNRRNRKDTSDPDAHDAYLRGWQLYRRHTPEDFLEAIPHFERAVEFDPDYGQAWATLASLYWITYRKGYAWSSVVRPDLSPWNSWIGARRLAEKYLDHAKQNPTPLAHQVESQMWWDFRQFDKVLSEAEQAVALDPNDPEGHLAMAWALIFAGHAEAAIASAERAMRLDPYFPANYRFAHGTAQLLLERYAAAEATLTSALKIAPGELELMAPLTVAYARLGKIEDARAALQKYTDIWVYREPNIDEYMEFWPFKREADFRLFGGGLIKAGLCCDEQLETYIHRLRQGGTLE